MTATAYICGIQVFYQYVYRIPVAYAVGNSGFCYPVRKFLWFWTAIRVCSFQLLLFIIVASLWLADT